MAGQSGQVESRRGHDGRGSHGGGRAAHLHACDACGVRHSSGRTNQSAAERAAARDDGLFPKAVHRKPQIVAYEGQSLDETNISGALPELLPVRVDRLGTGDTNNAACTPPRSPART